ncbi:MAG TPA: primosomal protein N' [Myxococcota bacterium]|nr:primosomal protein N' [Myxococcota bacterium]
MSSAPDPPPLAARMSEVSAPEALFAESGRVAKVALPVPVDELFEYTIPDARAGQIRPGCRVRVRFGGRTMVGVVVERADRAAYAGRLRAIEAAIDEAPVLPRELLGVLREAAREVLCPVGLAFAAALPTGSAPLYARGVALTPRGRAALESGAVKGAAGRALEALAAAPLPRAAIARRLGADARSALASLQRDGLIAACEIERGPRARVAVERVAALAPAVDLAAARAALARAPRQLAVLEQLAIRERATAGLPAAALRALTARGFARVHTRGAPRDVLGTPIETARRVELTRDQAAALAPIESAIRRREASAFLLHGVTGSGKTEIYLRAVAAALDAGRGALVLVPEITLTHQILARLRGRFGDALAVLHSGLSPGERLEQWLRLRSGAAPIAVGARSALFAPIEDLGIVVIDEEHDGAYKNEEGFRYHARDLARMRARAARCPVVLGSATPSLESRHAADRGEITRLVLAHRIGGQPLPAVEIVDLAREREASPRGRRFALSRPLRAALGETLSSGGQAILFLNRRGFSTRIFCFDCGHAERCADCDVGLVYHAADGALHCHYCEHRRPPPGRCTGCGAPDTALLGLGTERLEEEVRTLFPHARTARLDRDTAARRGVTEDVLRRLRQSRIDVLIGTQMVAKGHDYPGVRLVGVVAADIGLHLPDFRAAERTFQLLTQVAGRAGRDTAPGRVIVQTFVPDHYAVRPVRDHDYETFYAQELAHRRALGFPPLGHLASVLVSAEREADAVAGAAQLAAAIAAAGACELLGPAPAPLPRLRGRHRHQLLIKGGRDAVQSAARAALAAAARLRDGVTAAVDVRPWSML